MFATLTDLARLHIVVVLLHVQRARVNEVELAGALVPRQPIGHAHVGLQIGQRLVARHPVQTALGRLENVAALLQAHGAAEQATGRIGLRIVPAVGQVARLRLHLDGDAQQLGGRRATVPLDDADATAEADGKLAGGTLDRDDEGDDRLAGCK